jgi:hypothetical protein
VQELTGLTVPEGEEVVLVDDSDGGLWAWLTADSDSYCADPDLSTGLGNLILNSIVGNAPAGTPEERLAAEVERARALRMESSQARSYLVVRRDGTTADFGDEGQEREIGDVVMRLGGPSRPEIDTDTKRVSAALALALAIRTDHPVTVRSFASSLIFDRGDGKKLIVKRLESSAHASVWTNYSPNVTDAVAGTFRELERLADLSRVLDLFLSSIENSPDRLRSFQSGWAALEIFVNKVFGQYQARVTEGMDEGGSAQSLAQELLKEKYSLLDRFVLVATCLAPDEAQADSVPFMAAKKKRDHLYHGQDVDEKSLPVGDVHDLLKKYLHLHAQEVRPD